MNRIWASYVPLATYAPVTVVPFNPAHVCALNEASEALMRLNENSMRTIEEVEEYEAHSFDGTEWRV